jgi:hypothetical protein
MKRTREEVHRPVQMIRDDIVVTYMAATIRDDTLGVLWSQSKNIMYLDDDTTAGDVDAFWRAKVHKQQTDLMTISICGEEVEDWQNVLPLLELSCTNLIVISRSNKMIEIRIRDSLTGHVDERNMWIEPTCTFGDIHARWAIATGGRVRDTFLSIEGTRHRCEDQVLPNLTLLRTVDIEWNGDDFPRLAMHKLFCQFFEEAEEAGAPEAPACSPPKTAPVPQQFGSPLEPHDVHIHIMTAGQPGNVWCKVFWCSD